MGLTPPPPRAGREPGRAGGRHGAEPLSLVAAHSQASWGVGRSLGKPGGCGWSWCLSLRTCEQLGLTADLVLSWHFTSHPTRPLSGGHQPAPAPPRGPCPQGSAV